MVNILVGPDQESFYLHKKLLNEKCPYFEIRMKECWDGHKDEPLQLGDVNVIGFQVVVDWIYSGVLPMRLITLSDVYRAIYLAPAYKAADQLGTIDLQNKIIDHELFVLGISNVDQQFSTLLRVLDLDLSHTPYYHMVLKSCVRKLVLSPMCQANMSAYLGMLAKHDQALTDIILCMNQYNAEAWGLVRGRNACEFHVHIDGKKCRNTAKASETSQKRIGTPFNRKISPPYDAIDISG